MKKMKKTQFLSAVVTMLMVIAMAANMFVPSIVEASEDKTANMEGFSATLIADPDTSNDGNIFNGSPSEDGKIWTDKSVTTGTIYGATAGEKNFNIALSAMGQTYSTVTTSMETNQQKVAYDVVFVLDCSGSMAQNISSSEKTAKAQALVKAVNPAITTLMENENNRIGIITYAGSGYSENAASDFFALDHYATTQNGEYLQYQNSSIRSARSNNTYYVTNSAGTPMNKSAAVSGGTPTQAGIYRGMNMLKNASRDETITRIPIMILLSDGAAGRAKEGYKDLSGTTWEGSAANEHDDAEVGAYTMLTANYAKDQVNAAYRGYYQDQYEGIIPSDESVAKFYTIGFGITDTEWTHFMLEPSTTKANNDSIVRDIKTILNSESDYANNYDYVNQYFGGSLSEAELMQIFENIIADMEVDPGITTTVNNPVSSESGSSAAEDSVITFTDYLGYKMELKGEKQYLRYDDGKGEENYQFDKRSDGTYTFSGKTQSGAQKNPMVTVGSGDTAKTYTLNDVVFKSEFEKDKTVNGQTGYWKVTWQFPSALLPMYSRANNYDVIPNPIRMLYEVGLTEDANLATDGLKIDSDGNMLLDQNSEEFNDYAFYTNLYKFGPDGKIENGQAEARVDFEPALDNPYYYKTGYTTEAVENADKYLKLDMITRSKETVELQGTASVSLTNVNINTKNNNAESVSFSYDGRNYSIGMSGNAPNYNGTTNLEVEGETATEEKIKGTIPVEASITRTSSGWWNPTYSFTLTLTIGGQQATLSSNNTVARANNVPISQKTEQEIEGSEQVISVYLKLEEDENGLFVMDLAENRIDVTKESEETYKIVIGSETYLSNTYYKYPEGTVNYESKELPKGNVAKSYVGNFEIVQSNEELTEENFRSRFIYRTSNGTSIPATGIIFPDGNKLGDITESGPANRPPEGTIKVCVDGITNDAVNMTVNFDFIVEKQATVEGDIIYTALDCAYFASNDTEQNQAVDMHMSNTPEIREGNYIYDVSYTVTRDNPDDKEHEQNKTHTHKNFFTSSLTDGNLGVNFGNNGRISVLIEGETSDYGVTVRKQWVNSEGELLESNNPQLANLSIQAGIYQNYSYTAADDTVISSDGNAAAFDVVTLNQANGFSHTWNASELPKYLVNESGQYVLDKGGNQVEITYTTGESVGTDGWVLEEYAPDFVVDENGNRVYTLSNVPDQNISPSVQKVWTVDGTIANAPAGYIVKMELLANGAVVDKAAKYETEPVIVTLTEADVDTNATLHVEYRDMDQTETIDITTDFADTNKKIYTFVNDNPMGDTANNTYAARSEVKVALAHTQGQKLTIAGVQTVYYGNDNTTPLQTLTPATVEKKQDGDTTTASYIMEYVYEQEAVGYLDGVADGQDVTTGETASWKYTWAAEEWSLPSIKKADDGTYKTIEYSVRETILVPDVNGAVTVDGKTYTEYEPDATTGLITIGNDVYKSTLTSIDDGVSYQFEMNNDLGVTSRTAQKVWVDNNNSYDTRPAQIVFNLYADGTILTDLAKTINPTDNADVWNGTEKVTWSNLPKYNTATGNEIVYTVSEGAIQTTEDVYTTTVTTDPNDSDNTIITNRLAPNTTFMNVEKVWVDNNDAEGRRPDNIYMVLYSKIDGDSAEPTRVAESVITLSNTTLTGSWSDLPKYNNEGKKIIYSVKEYSNLNPVVEGALGYKDVSLTTDKTETSYKFTNQLEDGEISKTVTKVWKDQALENERPDNVTVELSAKTVNGADVDLTAYNPEKTLSGESDTAWSYTWENLPEYQNGEKINYTITETLVGTTAVDSTTNKAGIYAVSITDDGAGDTFTITNTLSDVTTVSVQKVWEDTPDDYEIPDVNFTVIGENSTEVGTLTVTKDSLTDTLTDLPKYNANGEVIEYQVYEDTIEGTNKYQIDSVIGDNTATDGTFAYTATNTYVPLVQDISGSKTWVGVTGNNIPSEITLALYRQIGDGQKELVTEDADGVALAPTWNKDVATEWTYSYANLPIYEDNEDYDTEYTYTVEETKVGNTDVVNNKAGDFTVDYDDSNLNITNTLGGRVEGDDLEGTKTWVNVTEANVPDSISVQLMRNIVGGTPEVAVDTAGEEVDAISVAKDGQADVMEWSYDFTDITLPKYDADGNEYIYSVTEVSVTADTTTATVTYTDATTGTVGDYTVTLDGLDITNTLKQGNDKDTTVSHPVTKIWIVADGTTLPASIEVELRGTGEEPITQPQVLTADDHANPNNAKEWNYTFENLRKYTDNGITEYVYSAAETKVGETAVNSNKAGAYSVSTDATAARTTITNSLGDSTTDITITKTWANVEEENIPDSININLNGGAAVQNANVTKEANATDDPMVWKYTFEDMPMYSDGVTPYEYYVEEVSVTAGTYTETVDRTGAEVIVGDYTVTEDGLNITNTLRQGDDKDYSVDYPVTKTWQDAEEQIPDSITIQLMKDGADEGNAVVLNANDNPGDNKNQWKYTYENLRKYTDDGITPYEYTAKETKIENTAVASGKAGDFFVTYTQQDANGTVINNRLATEDVDKELINYPVTKQWQDKDGNPLTENLPDSIKVRLYQGETEIYSKELNAGKEWKHTFGGVRKYEDDGLTLYTYSADEESITTGETVIAVANGKAGAYEVTVNVKENNAGTEIINKQTRDTVLLTTSISGTKSWKNQAGGDLTTHPDSITVQLVQDGKDVPNATQVVNKDTNWKYSFTDLEKYQANGIIEHVYTVRETHVGDVELKDSEYTSNVGTDNNITNTLKDIRINYSGEKIWRDAGNPGARPKTVEIELLANGNSMNPVETKTVSEADEWKYDFTNLAKYDATGALINYSVKELKIGDVNVSINNGVSTAGVYTVTYQGTNVVNTLQAGSRDITFTKHWDDDNDHEQFRPDSIEITMNDKTYTMTEADHKSDNNTWKMTVTDLPRYDANGDLIVYATPFETAIAHYTNERFSGDMDNGFEITNTFTPEDVTTFSVTKIWKDKNNEYNTRPETITVELYQDGELYGNPVTLSEANGWAHTWSSLPRVNGEGKEHVYTADETAIRGYTPSWSNDGHTVTNTLVGTVTLNAEKTWTNVSEAYRPTEVTVVLKQNGTTISKADLTAKNEWRYEFGSFDKYDANGVKYDYTVEEVAIDGAAIGETDYKMPVYNAPNLDQGETDFEVVNTLDMSKTVEIAGTKTWIDNDDQFGFRPDSITIRVYGDDKFVAKKVVTEKDKWTYSFKDLPKYDENGKAITYHITEDEVEGYTTHIEGTNIANTLKDEMIPVEKPEEPKAPDTGDGSPLIAYAILFIASGLLYAANEMKKRLNYHKK